MLGTVCGLIAFVSAQGTLQDFRVRTELLPGYGDLPSPPMYAGRLALGDDPVAAERSLFFWLVEPLAARAAPLDRHESKLGIWLQGGPGCSSMAGFFLENGPIRVHAAEAGSSEPWQLSWNELTWTEKIPMLYVEQPAGVGFATTGVGTAIPEQTPPGNASATRADAASDGIDQDEWQVASDFGAFLRRWLAHPQFARYRGARLFFFGESYAGTYVPMIVHHLLETGAKVAPIVGNSNEGDSVATSAIRLGGMALGNGWVDPVTQTPAYIDYAFGHGMIDEGGRGVLQEQWAACHAAFEAATSAWTRARAAGAMSAAVREAYYVAVKAVQTGCGIMEMVQAAAAGANEYDTSLFGEYLFLDAPCATGAGNAACKYATFLNDARVQRALHLNDAGRPWSLCNAEVNGVLLADTPVGVLPQLASVLDEGLPTLLYSGERDLSCNFLGTQKFLGGLKWRGRAAYNGSPRATWRVPLQPPASRAAAEALARGESSIGAEVAGFVRAHANLQFLVVVNSGHLVPFSQPWAALDLVTRFTTGRPFADTALPSWDGASRSVRAGAQLGASEAASSHSTVQSSATSSLPVWLLTLIAFVAGAVIAAPLSAYATRLRVHGYHSRDCDASENGSSGYGVVLRRVGTHGDVHESAPADETGSIIARRRTKASSTGISSSAKTSTAYGTIYGTGDFRSPLMPLNPATATLADSS